MHQSEIKKRRDELRAFQMLAPLIDLQVVPQTIIQSAPPAPDIECEIVGHGRLAVELTALDSGSSRHRLSNMTATPTAWARALGHRPGHERTQLQRDADDLTLSLVLDERANITARVGIMKAIQDVLLASPGYRGRLFATSVPPEGFRSGHAHRGYVRRGPRIYAPSAGPWLPPQVSKIVQKLTTKKYETEAPLVLFAYTLHDEPDCAVGLLAQIDATVRAHLPGSSFQRVHLFHFGFGQHI